MKDNTEKKQEQQNTQLEQLSEQELEQVTGGKTVIFESYPGKKERFSREIVRPAD